MIQITENAANQIQKMLIKRALGETGLRIGVKAGGCSGFEYIFRWEQSPKDTDVVCEGPVSAKVFVDPKSLRITRSLDSMFGLDEEAKKAVRQWRFRPGIQTRTGQPVPVQVLVELTFTLR